MISFSGTFDSFFTAKGHYSGHLIMQHAMGMQPSPDSLDSVDSLQTPRDSILREEASYHAHAMFTEYCVRFRTGRGYRRFKVRGGRASGVPKEFQAIPRHPKPSHGMPWRLQKDSN